MVTKKKPHLQLKNDGTVQKKAPAKKAPVKKAPVKKAATKKAPVKKAAPKKAAVKKAQPKAKATPQRTPANRGSANPKNTPRANTSGFSAGEVIKKASKGAKFLAAAGRVTPLGVTAVNQAYKSKANKIANTNRSPDEATRKVADIYQKKYAAKEEGPLKEAMRMRIAKKKKK